MLLPFNQFRQELDGREYPFIGLSALYALYLILSGYSLPLNAINIAAISYALWLCASLLWTSHPHSAHELFNWLSYMVLFLAAQALRIDIVLWFIFPVGLLFAGMQIYRYLIKRGDPLFILGNTSHSAAFILSGLMACIWLSGINTGVLSLILSIFILPLIFAVTATKSKGGISAMLISLFFMSIFLKSPFLLSVSIAVLLSIGLWMFVNRRHNWGVTGSLRERKLIFAAALVIIKDKPLIGYGLQMFRKLMPFATARLYKEKWFDKLIKERSAEYKGDNIYSNKVHNDILETIVEVGIIGLALLIYLFSQFQLDVYSAGFFVMAVVSSLWFFYFRNTHTAVPFWAVMGAVAAGNVNNGAGYSMLILKAVMAAIIVVIITLVFKKFIGLVHYTEAVLTPDINKKLDLTQKAINCDPNNGDYLNYHAFNSFLVNPAAALLYTMRGLLVYDGNRQIWGLWNTLCRLIFNMNKLQIAGWANQNAFSFFPDHQESKDIKNAIETMKLTLNGNFKEAEEKLDKMRGGTGGVK